MSLSLNVLLTVTGAIGGVQFADTAEYWQQEVDYRIVATLDEAAGVLSGRASITYTNRSSDTLTEFFLHQYLNAFRPGSRWADRDSIAGNRRFNDLEDPDYAFERLTGSAIDGQAVTPQYPYSPDSTIVRLALPRPLAPGQTIIVDVEWQARPSTVPRRQARRGRRFDFAQWYPRVVVYDHDGWQDHPLYPSGEFYGEFATYDVTFDLPADQVIGATGVPIEGDPGWEAARADPDRAVNYQRDWYGAVPVATAGALEPSGCSALDLASGRKCVRFLARDVHHFAMSLNPDYVYEEGRYEDVIVRVLYTPSDRSTWGDGIALDRTVQALRWLDDLFGEYPWPQLTNLHRIEGGGTEFPMVIMDGSANLGLILHETGHQYAMGILANNEWKEGFLDEGLTSFQTSWYFEEQGEPSPYYILEPQLLSMDLAGWSEPVATHGEDFRDFATYNVMTYAKAQLFYYQLRYIVGDNTMREILREYSARWKFKHVTAAAFQRVAEDVSGMDLGWLFDQWLHQTVLIDYALGDVERDRTGLEEWETTVEVERVSAGRMPIEIGTQEGPDGRPVVYARADGADRVSTVSFETDREPGRLMLDPLVRSHDWNFTNNRERGFLVPSGVRWRLDTFFSEPSERDRSVVSIAPMGWWHDASDVVIGLRWRSNYMGRYNRWIIELHRGIGGFQATTQSHEIADYYVEFANPTWLQSPGWSQSVATWAQEGTVGARLQMAKSTATITTPNSREIGATVQWVATEQTSFLDPRQWDNAGTIEAGFFTRWNEREGSTRWGYRFEASGGTVYQNSNAPDQGPYEWRPLARATTSMHLRHSVGGFTLGLRGFAGGVWQDGARPARQRGIPINGADPYQTRRNPFVRTQGAPLVGPDVFYHSPGNANMRGYRPGLDGRWALSVNAELERSIIRRRTGVFRGVSLVGFWDAASVDTVAVPSLSANAYKTIFDAGAGVRAWFHIGDVTFPVRVEFPFYVSTPSNAHNRNGGNDQVEFRWLVSFQPIF